MTVISQLVIAMIFTLLGVVLCRTVSELKKIRKEDYVDFSEVKGLEVIRTLAAAAIVERRQLDRETDNGAIEYWYVIKEAAELLAVMRTGGVSQRL
jgi:hypothetical protein